MKTLNTLIATACLAVVLPASVYAESMRVSVPFRFHVGPEVFPAGEYVVTTEYNRNVAHWQAVDATVACYTPIMVRSTVSPLNTGKIVFRTYGDSAFLQSIEPASGLTYRMFPSAREKESARGRSQRVIVAEIHR